MSLGPDLTHHQKKLSGLVQIAGIRTAYSVIWYGETAQTFMPHLSIHLVVYVFHEWKS